MTDWHEEQARLRGDVWDRVDAWTIRAGLVVIVALLAGLVL